MGLYDDDNAAITSGDLCDVIYWQTKFSHLKLQAALQSRQPEYAVRGLIPSVVNGSVDVLKTWPNHAEVKAWADKAGTIAAKIDPNAAPADFTGDFAHWKDYAYEAGWRSYHVAQMAAAENRWGMAAEHAKEAITQLGRAKDRMTHWATDAQQFVVIAVPEMERLREASMARL